MARLVAAFGSSHSIMLAAPREDWQRAFRDSDRRMPLFDANGNATSYDALLGAAPPDSESMVTADKLSTAYDRTFAAVAELKRQMDEVPLDCLVVIGDDQHELFQDAMMPSLAVYYGETIRNAAQRAVPGGDWYKRAQQQRLEPEGDAHYAVHAELARHFIEGLTDLEFDVCAVREINADQYEGHAYSYIHRTYLCGRSLPVVPIMLNTYYPPNPVSPRRCVQLGRALKALIEDFPKDMRVGVIASGGLSHFVVDEELDRGVLKALAERDLGHLGRLEPKRLQAGSSEIRSWIATAAAAIDLNLAWSAYIPAYRTPALTGTGLAFARWAYLEQS
jgi:3-O-methylgallate 3,4-dioxygenase